MSDIMIMSVLCMMVVMAIVTIVSNRLFTAIVYAGVLSFLSAFLYVLLGAPDIALAEAVIGATIVTTIFLVTLKKYRIFNIYVLSTSKKSYDFDVLSKISNSLRNHDIEVHTIHVNKKLEEVLNHTNCDMVLEKVGDKVYVHASEGNQHMKEIAHVLEKEIALGKVKMIEDA